MTTTIREITHAHLFCGLGGGAKGFNEGEARVGSVTAKFTCLGGIDVDPVAIRDFGRLAGVPGTVMDLFDRDQYTDFHGRPPPDGWTEALPDDIRRAFQNRRPNIVFLSAPCKGFSGLLAESKSITGKYQALNRLTVRGVWLTLEAYKDDPIELFVFENVPRIASRGRKLLDQIKKLFHHYGYVSAETTHDCGELGGLAQSRKRFLLVARHAAKVPNFLYEPEKKTLKPVGDILSRMPVPGTDAFGEMIGGPMHRIPALQWKTWVRLAFVEPGSDWRSLNKLRVVDGKLADYLIVPENRNNGFLGVQEWNEPSGTIAGRNMPHNGTFSIADPRFAQSEKWTDGQAYGVRSWDKPTGTITSKNIPGQGAYSVGDPRMKSETEADRHKNVFRVVRFGEAAGTVSGGHGPSSGGQCVADPRHHGKDKHSNEYHVLPFAEPGKAVTSAHSTGQCVADPRVKAERAGPFGVTDWNEPSKTVAGESFPTNGEFAVADPRPPEKHFSKYNVTDWKDPTGTVISSDDHGAYAVSDPRTLHREKGDNFYGGGHYGVVPFDQHAGAVSAAAGYDNGRWSVADPRMPEATENLVCVIRSIHDTWNRPFTTLELAALQSLLEPEEHFELEGLSDSAWRERIGNAVPAKAAKAIAGVMGTTIMLAEQGETFALSNTPIWVRNIAIALSTRQGDIA